jgi:hypothetical protein
MKQALEALELVVVDVKTTSNAYEAQRQAITALRQAIAEAEKQEQGEPVAWRFKTGTFWNREPHWRYVLSLEGTEGLQGLEPLYTHPQRTWVGLTDEELEPICNEWRILFGSWTQEFAKAIETKLKDKNT